MNFQNKNIQRNPLKYGNYGGNEHYVDVLHF